jgi:hypothetical protein
VLKELAVAIFVNRGRFKSNMKAANSVETPVIIYHSTPRHIDEG